MRSVLLANFLTVTGFSRRKFFACTYYGLSYLCVAGTRLSIESAARARTPGLLATPWRAGPTPGRWYVVGHDREFVMQNKCPQVWHARHCCPFALSHTLSFIYSRPTCRITGYDIVDLIHDVLRKLTTSPQVRPVNYCKCPKHWNPHFAKCWGSAEQLRGSDKNLVPAVNYFELTVMNSKLVTLGQYILYDCRRCYGEINLLLLRCLRCFFHRGLFISGNIIFILDILLRKLASCFSSTPVGNLAKFY